MAAPAFRKCVKCFFTERKATRRVNICLDEDRYPLDLCDEHAETLEKWLAQWTYMLIDPIEHRPPIKFGPQRERRDTRPVPIPVRVVEPEPEPEPKPEPEPVALSLFNTPSVPAGADEWNVTNHAHQRGESPERNISDEEMLWAAIRPDKVTPSNSSDHQVNYRGPVAVVVAPEVKTIVTCYRPYSEDEPDIPTNGKR